MRLKFLNDHEYDKFRNRHYWLEDGLNVPCNCTVKHHSFREWISYWVKKDIITHNLYIHPQIDQFVLVDVIMVI